jgi:arginase
LAVKIIRQPKKIVLIGAPTSAAANAAGCEAAPAALRKAGIAARLEQIGYEVSDAGDIAANAWRADDETPRARNAAATVRSLEALQPLVEKAVKSGALPVILGGDCTVTMAALAAIRRYYKEVSLIWCDSDADLNTPATTPSGFLHGMVVGHIAGQGAPELVRFFKEPPLVREPDIALFGLSRIDPGEQKWMDVSPMRKFTPDEIRELGPAAAAEMALERIHIFKRQWALHFDVDVLAATEMPATYYPAENGLRGVEFAEALAVFASNPNLAAITLASYVPSADADGAAGARLLDLFAEAMAARYRALAEAPAAPAPEASPAEEAKESAAEEAKEPGSTPAESSASETIAESEASVGDAASEAISEAAAAASVESASEAASGAASDEVTAPGTNDAASDPADEFAGDPVSEEKSEGS